MKLRRSASIVEALNRNWMLRYLWIEGGITPPRSQWSSASRIGELHVQNVLCLSNLVYKAFQALSMIWHLWGTVLNCHFCVGRSDIRDV